TPNEIQRCDTSNSRAVSLPERTIDRPPGFQVGTLFLRTGSADHFGKTRLSEVGGDQPALAHLHPRTCIRVDHAPDVAPGARHPVRMTPKVRQFAFVPPDHEQ